MIKKLVSELRKDNSPGSLYHSYQANIAMAFKDEFARLKHRQKGGYINRGHIHTIANRAAKNFLDILIRDASNS